MPGPQPEPTITSVATPIATPTPESGEGEEPSPQTESLITSQATASAPVQQIIKTDATWEELDRVTLQVIGNAVPKPGLPGSIFDLPDAVPIWGRDDSPGSSALLQKRFTIPPGAVNRSASISYSADDRVEIRLNGQLVGIYDFRVAPPPNVDDLTPFLQVGENVLQALVTNRPAIAWFEARAEIRYQVVQFDNPGNVPYQEFSEEPVNTLNGNYLYTREDLSIPSRGLATWIVRVYNSIDNGDGPFGFGWTFNYHITATENADGFVEIGNADGRRDLYSPDGLGGYSPPPAVVSTLTKNPDGTFLLTRTDQTRIAFDSNGRLQSITDSNANTIALAYDARGNLATVTDPVGRQLHFVFDASGHITSITDAAGRTLQYGYDAARNLISFIDPAGGTWIYSYDENHGLLAITDPNGHVVVTNHYDAQGRVESQLDAAGNQTTFAYDGENHITLITDALGNVTRHHYDQLFRFVRRDDALGKSSFFEYDEPFNRVAVVDPQGNRTSLSYDSRGNLLSLTDPLENVTSFTYDARNNLTSITDPLGRFTTYEYDARNNLVRIIDALGGVTSFEYDELGQLIRMTDANGHSTSFAYDGEGNLTEVVDPQGNRTSYSYDVVGRRTTLIDANRNTWAYAYDPLDRITQVTDPLGHITTFAYDGVGNLVRITDANGNATTYSYDERDNLDTVIQNPGPGITFTTIYAYDPNNSLTAATDANGHTRMFTYDALNRLASAADPLGNTTSYRNDANGNLISRTDANGRIATFTYDPVNRLTNITYADPSTPAVAYTYDAVGRRTSMTDGTGTTTYTYDGLDRLVQVAETGGYIFAYAYDAVGNRTAITYPTGRVVTYAYDAADRLVQTADGTAVTTTEYDPVGKLIREALPNGVESTFAYDAPNRLVEIRHALGGNLLSRFAYTLDAVGNRLNVTDVRDGVTRYEYDDLYRLTRVDYPPSPRGRGLSPHPRDTFTEYSYDPVGNRLTHTNFQGTFSYLYDAADRLVSLQKPHGRPQTFTYDANGNMLSRGADRFVYDLADRLLSFTLGRRGGRDDHAAIFGLPGVGQRPITFAYNGDGLRTQASIGNLGITYHWDVARALPVILWETGPREISLAEYTYGVDLLSLVEPRGARREEQFYYLQDGLGSVMQLTDSQGRVRLDYTYDAFGDIRALSIGWGRIPRNLFDFSAQQRDPLSGLIYLRFRYYEPTVGRFVTMDRGLANLSRPLTLNRYIYANCNPVTLKDPLGLAAQRAGVECEPVEAVGGALLITVSEIPVVGTALVVSRAPIPFPAKVEAIVKAHEATLPIFLIGFGLILHACGILDEAGESVKEFLRETLGIP